MKNLTPINFHCGFGQCPSIYELDDDTIAICGDFLSSPDRQKAKLPAPGIGEHYIKIPRKLFEDTVREYAMKMMESGTF